MDARATPVHHLLRAKELADRDLYYVYLGNIAGVGGNDTFCPRCAHLLIRREGYQAEAVGVSGGKCAACGRPAEVVL
jgi:pyruvate formate lyase activating enzyme